MHCIWFGASSIAVVVGFAAAAWIATVDESAVRNTQKIEILLRRADRESAILALESVGFIPRENAVILDGPNARNRDAVQFVFAGEIRSAGCEFPTPDATESFAWRRQMYS